jgi:hypothetical protein
VEKLTAAFATDDHVSLVSRHFGDAMFYDIYAISATEATLVKTMDNTTDSDENEHGHGDPTKAKGITGLLLTAGVAVAVSKVFGPNLKRIKKKLLCVISSGRRIDQSLDKLRANFPVLVDEWSKGKERDSLRL